VPTILATTGVVAGTYTLVSVDTKGRVLVGSNPSFRAPQGVPNSADSSTDGYAFGADGDTGLFSPIYAGGSINGMLALYSNDTQIFLGNTSGASFNVPVTLNSGLFETSVTLSTSNFALGTANLFKKTLSGATSFTVSNVPASGIVASFMLELTNGGSAVITWWGGLTWTGGAGPPSLSGSGVDILGFYTSNGGATWRGLLLGRGMA